MSSVRGLCPARLPYEDIDNSEAVRSEQRDPYVK